MEVGVAPEQSPGFVLALQKSCAALAKQVKTVESKCGLLERTLREKNAKILCLDSSNKEETRRLQMQLSKAIHNNHKNECPGPCTDASVDSIYVQSSCCRQWWHQSCEPSISHMKSEDLKNYVFSGCRACSSEPTGSIVYNALDGTREAWSTGDELNLIENE